MREDGTWWNEAINLNPCDVSDRGRQPAARSRRRPVLRRHGRARHRRRVIVHLAGDAVPGDWEDLRMAVRMVGYAWIGIQQTVPWERGIVLDGRS